MEPLQTWWTTELYPTSDEDNFGVVGNFEVVKAADAQATIAALQARVRELEEWVQDQSTANLETMRHTDEMQSRALEAEQQLTRRTAELERVRADNKALDKWRADVTVSLQRPEGAFFVDVPQHIKDLMKERDELRTLIAALPKVEGQFEVGSGACYYVRALDGKSNPIVCGLMTEQAVAYAILALLKHRQGMEGYP